jgi:putative flippase GtrA
MRPEGDRRAALAMTESVSGCALARRKQFLNFTVIGGVGFLIDAGILTVLSQVFGVNLYISRLFSFACASLSTWLLNRSFTFSDATRDVDVNSSEYFRYITVQIIGAFLNLAVFSVLIATFPALQKLPVLPLAVGAIFGLLFNFMGARLWVYPQKDRFFE